MSATYTVELTQDQLMLLGASLLSEIDRLTRRVASGYSSEYTQEDLRVALEVKDLLVRARAEVA